MGRWEVMKWKDPSERRKEKGDSEGNMDRDIYK